jgi:membrane protein YqaA with SNARE-associated domain
VEAASQDTARGLLCASSLFSATLLARNDEPCLLASPAGLREA